MTIKYLSIIGITMTLTACSTLTGIPSHGGGKRFAIEQELVSASSRASIKHLDLKSLKNHKVALFVSVIGDQGSGTLSGGRYSVDALIRGEYINNPSSSTENSYPNYTSTANTSAGTLSSLTKSTSLLNAPTLSKTISKGVAGKRSFGISTNGIGDYRNETLISNPRDVSFLNNLIQTVFYLRGIQVVSPEEADTDVFITVDVFGTIRSRTEMYAYNAETLRAITKMEYFAVDRNTGKLLIKPTASTYEAKYQENYALWIGPIKVDKDVKPSDGLMVDFSDIKPYSDEE